MKRSPLKKKSKVTEAKLKEKLWGLCRDIIRAKYPHTCYTCGATNLSGSNLQTGHMIAKASLGAFLKWDLRVLRNQCMVCNIHRGGMGAIFIENMRKIEGDEYVDQILKDMQVLIKCDRIWLEQKIKEYSSVLNCFTICCSLFVYGVV